MEEVHAMTDTTPSPPSELPRGLAEEAPSHEPDRRAERTWLLVAVRYVLPAAVARAGGAIMAMGSETDLEGGASILSAGLAIYLLNWLVRAGASGDREREREDAAREHFTRHGRWPD
jgi:hypothetical protein